MAHQNGVGLPVLSPVAAHAHPPGFGSFDAHPHDIPCTRDVGDQNQVEVAETVDGESDSSTLSAGYPTESNGDNSGAVLGDLEKHGHGKVEVGTRRVTPAAIVAGKSVVRWAEVGGGDEDGGAAGVAPLGVVGALDLKASATAEPAVEQCGAQCCRVDSVALAVEIPIPTSTPHSTGGIAATVECGMSTLPRPTGVNAGDSSMNQGKKGEE